LDSIPGADLDIVSAQRGLYDSKYAALYYPWMMIEDPFPDNPRNPGQVSVPPSGAVLGIIARTDITRGVFKAPANELVEGIEHLEFKLMKEQQDILNPQNINVVRDFREQLRGIRVWGARNVSSDPDWLYVNVRRLFNFIEHSIDIGTQPFVFEPNDQFLWQRVTRSISGFLKTVWRDGGLMGAKPEDAYFVHVGNDTMTPDDFANGRLIVEIGIAPVYPAEFVIFRIGQWVGGSSVSEG
jgi:phage tail sheath protein FI